MSRKYLKKQLEIRAGATRIYVYNDNGDLVRTHERSYTPKSWVVIPSDMPKEYSDYNYWNTPYFLSRAGAIGPNTRVLIQRVIEKFAYPVQSYRSCFGILRFAEKYGKEALENCCRDSVLYGKCSYNYVANPRLIVVANNQMLPAFKNGQIIWRSHQALKFAKSR